MGRKRRKRHRGGNTCASDREEQQGGEKKKEEKERFMYCVVEERKEVSERRVKGGKGGKEGLSEARKAAGKEKYPRVVNSNDIRVGSWLAARMRWMARRMQIWLVGMRRTDGQTDRRMDGPAKGCERERDAAWRCIDVLGAAL